jgi:hypothetical protein
MLGFRSKEKLYQFCACPEWKYGEMYVPRNQRFTPAIRTSYFLEVAFFASSMAEGLFSISSKTTWKPTFSRASTARFDAARTSSLGLILLMVRTAREPLAV